MYHIVEKAMQETVQKKREKIQKNKHLVFAFLNSILLNIIEKSVNFNMYL